MKQGHAILSLFLFLLAAAGAGASDYPLIKVLSSDDPLYVQHQAALADYYHAAKAREPEVLPPLTLFEYRLRSDEDLFSVNARLSISYDALATLNDAASKSEFDAHHTILLPSQPGLFVNDPPRSTLEDMMLSSLLASGKSPQKLMVVREGRPAPVLFFPGEQFTPMERAYFLGILFEFPIPRGKITSLFGMRRDPFTGGPDFHTGIDIGAPDGTEVHAARDGVVSEAGRDSVLGNFVVLTHPGGYQTVYGHLSVIGVTMNQKVNAGSVLGEVGHTGKATGPHLHFEVKRKGRFTDPLPLLAVRKD